MLRNQKYTELEEEHENQLSKKGRKNGTLKVGSNFMVNQFCHPWQYLSTLKTDKNASKTKLNL